jgi:hypothetical protein
VIVQRLREGDRISAVAMVDTSVEVDGLEGEPLPLEPVDGAVPAADVTVIPDVADAQADGDGSEDDELAEDDDADEEADY